MTSTFDPIGVFDSGVGGLSVLKEIHSLLPTEELIYLADSGYAPYGDRSNEFIKERVLAIAEFFIRQNVKAMVVACNTATAVAVQELREKYQLPIIAMEPAIKPAVEITRSRVIGILATSRTLASDKFSQLSERYGKGVDVVLQACPGFVEQVEQGDLTSAVTENIVRRYVSPLLDKQVDTLVLGCTHYPFLTPVIKKIAGENVTVIDPSPAVARELRRRLELQGLLATASQPDKVRYCTSGEIRQVQPVIAQLWGEAVDVQAMK